MFGPCHNISKYRDSENIIISCIYILCKLANRCVIFSFLFFFTMVGCVRLCVLWTAFVAFTSRSHSNSLFPFLSLIGHSFFMFSSFDIFLVFVFFVLVSGRPFICPICSFENSEPKEFVSHLRKNHAKSKSVGVDCVACSGYFQSVSSFLTHWYGKHHVRVTSASSIQHSVVTPGTSEATTREVNLTPALQSAESQSSIVFSEECAGPSQSVCVGQPDELQCDDHLRESDSPIQLVQCVYEQQLREEHDTIIQLDKEEEDMDVGAPLRERVILNEKQDTGSPLPKDLKEVAGMYVLDLKSRCGTTQESLKVVLNNTKDVIKEALQSFLSEMKDKKMSFDSNDLQKLVEEKSNIFTHVNTVDKQKKYFKEKFDLLEPVAVPVISEFKTTGFGENKKTKIVDKNASYVSLISLLEKIRSHPDYQKMCADYVNCNDPEVIDCFLKSNSAKANPVLKDHPDALRVILYYDDLEVCNPLGSASAKYKLGVFYVLLENIGPCHRSNLQLIGLLLVVHTDLLKFESGTGLGVESVLEDIVADFEKLENGVTLSNGETMYATLIACIGDNLGIHTVAGLKEGFTAHRPCRWCMVTETERMSFVKEDPALLRTDEEWDQQVKRIQSARTKKQKEALMKEFGIKRHTALGNLKSFSVTTGFPPDIVHDLLEHGVISIELKCILNHVIKEYPEVTLFMINERVKNFDYGHAEKSNKPAIIKKEHLEDDGHLRQKASQMWELATILPFILAPYVSKEDENWDNYMLLLEISRMIFSDSIRKSTLGYLQDCIAVYLTNFKALYGMHLTPKQHFLIHYPSLILIYGVLINFWTMRTEAKHKWFKRLVYILGNYKNIPWSLAEKHQVAQAQTFSQPLIQANLYGPVRKVQVCDAPYANLFPNLESVLEATWMTVKGIVFTPKDSFVPIKYNEDKDEPVFLLIEHTLAWPELFVCKRVQTEEYDTQVGAYPVVVTNELVTLRFCDMIGHRVHNAHHVDGKMFVASKVCFGSSF